MSDAFISYSRIDGDFVRRLNTAFVQANRVVWVDWQNIPRGEDWWQEIQRGIEDADTFLCIVSEHWLTSEICQRELSYARTNHKRVVPLIRERIEDEAEKRVDDFLAGKVKTYDGEEVMKELRASASKK